MAHTHRIVGDGVWWWGIARPHSNGRRARVGGLLIGRPLPRRRQLRRPGPIRSQLNVPACGGVDPPCRALDGGVVGAVRFRFQPRGGEVVCVIESERFKFWTNFWCFGRVSYTPKAPKSHAPHIRADRTQTVGIGLELDQNGCLPFDSLVSDSTDRSINPLIDID